MPDKIIRWYCRNCKKMIKAVLSEDFQKEFLEKAQYFPYPVIFKHGDGCYSILHLDRDFNFRSNLNTRFFMELNNT